MPHVQDECLYNLTNLQLLESEFISNLWPNRNTITLANKSNIIKIVIVKPGYYSCKLI